MPTQLLTPEQVAEMLGLKVKTLYNWRLVGEGPQAIKVGKYLRYRPEAVEAYIDSLDPKANVIPITRRAVA